MNKIGTLLTGAGIAFIGFNLSIYTVYPGERVTKYLIVGSHYEQYFWIEAINLFSRI